jgi:hypothetical protein
MSLQYGDVPPGGVVNVPPLPPGLFVAVVKGPPPPPPVPPPAPSPPPVPPSPPPAPPSPGAGVEEAAA